VIAPHKGTIRRSGRAPDELAVDRSFQTACPAEADAFIIAAGSGLQDHPAVINWVQTAYRHYKPIAAWGDGELVLTNAGVASDAPGVVVTPRAGQQLARALITELGGHRSWDRADPHPTRSQGRS
jgi:catalase